MKLKIIKFKAKKGASFGNDKAQIYGRELERIQEVNNGLLTPLDVLNRAKDKTNPLHDYFEWDNKKASDKWRMHQARLLINHIEIETTFKGSEDTIRRYLNATKSEDENNDDKSRVYVITEKALSEEEYRNQVLKRALEEIDYWKHKYKQYKELSLIFESIVKTKKKIKI